MAGESRAVNLLFFVILVLTAVVVVFFPSKSLNLFPIFSEQWRVKAAP